LYLADHSDLYHASITQGEVIELGVFTFEQLRNIIIQTAPKRNSFGASDVLRTAIARDGTFEMNNWRIKVLRIVR
jgi:hydroxypyruvate isomerase